MAKSRSTREAKLVPWYHVQKPPCVMLTVKSELCLSSASWVAVDRAELTLCKTHRDMMPDRAFKRIRPTRADLRRLRDQLGGSVPLSVAPPRVEFRSA